MLKKYESLYRKDADDVALAELEYAGLGSLQECTLEHINQYDVVVGNPPWATSTGLRGWKWLQRKIDSDAVMRLKQEKFRVALPNEVLDLPFVWRAMEWAKPNAHIIFALHARLLFQQGDTMPSARSALFGALDITGIINGAELRKTNIWPEITAPFCLLFARNRVPSPGSGFRFVSPHIESQLNRSGVWRIDVSNSEIVLSEEVRRNSTLLKTLYRGSRLDSEIMNKILSNKWPSVKEQWRSMFDSGRHYIRCTGNGYQKIRSSSRIRKFGDGFPGVSATYLKGRPELDPSTDRKLVIMDRNKRAFSQIRIHDPRALEIFKAPLIIVPEVPPVRMGRIAVSVSFSDLIYNQSYHGYSTSEYAHGIVLAKYLSLIFSSRLLMWHALMTSGRFGFEREVIEKFVIDNMVFRPIDFFSKIVTQEISDLFDRVAADGSDNIWREVDVWIYKIYGLHESDVRVIEDTLRHNLPYARNRDDAQKPVSQDEKNAFCQSLNEELDVWVLGDKNRKILINSLNDHPLSPWRFLKISRTNASQDENDSVSCMQVALHAANSSGATEIKIVDEARQSIFLGRINEARYWTYSRARICAQSLMWDHADLLFEDRS